MLKNNGKTIEWFLIDAQKVISDWSRKMLIKIWLVERDVDKKIYNEIEWSYVSWSRCFKLCFETYFGKRLQHWDHPSYFCYYGVCIKKAMRENVPERLKFLKMCVSWLRRNFNIFTVCKSWYLSYIIARDER